MDYNRRNYGRVEEGILHFKQRKPLLNLQSKKEFIFRHKAPTANSLEYRLFRRGVQNREFGLLFTPSSLNTKFFPVPSIS